MRWLRRLWFVICLTAAVVAINGSLASAQQVRVVQQAQAPDQWSVSFTRKNSPDDFEFDGVYPSLEAARHRVMALRAWSSYFPLTDYEWKLAVILISGESKADGPVPDPPEKKSPKSSVTPGNASAEQAPPEQEAKTPPKESVAIEPPAFARFLTEVADPNSAAVPKIAGKQGTGTLGTTQVTIDFDGDSTMNVKGPDKKLISSGTWLQSDSVLTFATPSYVYVGNVGTDKAKGVRWKNGPRLGSVEEEWSLSLSTADPIVGTWQLLSRKVGKEVGDNEDYYTTKLAFKMDHTVSVDWVVTSTRKGSTAREKVTDFDHSTAHWEIRDGKIYFTNPRIIRNWHGKDVQWSWFDPHHPLNVDSLKTWEKIK